MRILMASSEAVPFAKTGGLADVAGALPKALKNMGIDVALVMPKYRTVDKEGFQLRETGITLNVPTAGGIKRAEVLKGNIKGNIPVYFIKKDKYYDRDGLYGTMDGDFPDNAERFIFFSRAAIELCKELNFKADIIHCNDWQTSLIPVYLKTVYRDDPFFSGTATVLTIHNIGYQGLFWHFDMHLTGLGWDLFTPEGVEFFGKINLLKAGLMFSDIITTVSKGYCNEIQTRELGHGLEGVIAKRKNALYGIVNGIDYDEWDPAKDISITSKYSLENIKGKGICKSDLQKFYSLPIKKDVPLIAMISRLAGQKGFDLVEGAIEELAAMDMQMVFLGAGDRKYQDLLEQIGTRYPKKIGVRIGYDVDLAHKIEAGADMFLMPSRYEPCGLNQLYSLKYGTVPVVRATGGLDDTIKEFNPKTGRGNGFKFKEYSSEALLRSVRKAVGLYKDKKAWEKIMQNGMACDFSWEHSAREYLKIYKKALQSTGSNNV